jgi:hypothetical protein
MCAIHNKILKKLEKIIRNLSGKENKNLMKMFQIGEGGSKGDQHETFLWFFTNHPLLNNNS